MNLKLIMVIIIQMILQCLIKYINKYHKMRLGDQVLDKISNLLVEVDRPKSPKRKRQIATERGSHQPDNNNNRLYNNYRKMKQRLYEKQKQQMMQELNQMHSFRVHNKHSIFLNNRRQERPIYERAQNIIEEREISIEKKRMELQIQRERNKILKGENALDDEEAFQEERSKSKSARKVSKQELTEILNRLTQKQRQKTSKETSKKMGYLKEKLLNNKMKPDIDGQSQRLFEKRKLQKSLSSNVFERLDRYKWEQIREKQKFIEKVREKQTPFKPQISKNSHRIATSMQNKKPLFQDLDRSPSCKCFIKGHKHQSMMMTTSRKSLNKSRSTSFIKKKNK